MKADILVVGGSFTGMIMAAALARFGFSVVIIDKADPKEMRARRADGRTLALAHAGVNLLRAIGLWEKVAPLACPIDEIRVTDSDAPVFLHYDHHEIGDAPLGHIVENHDLWNVAFDHLADLDSVTYLAPKNLTNLARDQYGVSATIDDGMDIEAALVLACDGRNSSIREAAGIETNGWDYGQTAIVVTIGHAVPHGNIAHERFLPGGPFAILPLTDQDGKHRSSIVWSERSDLVADLMALDGPAFGAELGRRVGDFLGVIEVLGRRWSYPLSLMHARRYTDTRLALVADAAHAIHPIAGQGLNMGLRDVAALAEILVNARRLGRDIGAADNLAAYERWRHFDNTALAFACDGLTRLFSNNIGPLKLARNIGLAAVNATPPLRRFFMRHAMGMVGDLPKLLKGEPL